MNSNETFRSKGHGADATCEPIIRRPSSTDTERPPSAQRVHKDENDRPPSEHEEEEADAEADLANQIADFDWEGLAERYHASIKKCENNEAELMEEFQKLMNYFRIWAESGHVHDTGRTFSRLHTRSLHVQNSEANLEKTRNHYNQVVKAFESAMKLLSNMN